MSMKGTDRLWVEHGYNSGVSLNSFDIPNRLHQALLGAQMPPNFLARALTSLKCQTVYYRV
jgi:hypothetical protein